MKKKTTLTGILLTLVVTISFPLSACKDKNKDEHDFVDGRCTICGETEGLVYTLQEDEYRRYLSKNGVYVSYDDVWVTFYNQDGIY